MCILNTHTHNHKRLKLIKSDTIICFFFSTVEKNRIPSLYTQSVFCFDRSEYYRSFEENRQKKFEAQRCKQTNKMYPHTLNGNNVWMSGGGGGGGN